MIVNLQNEIDKMPADARAAIADGALARGGISALLLAVALPPVRQVMRGIVAVWRCPGCGLASPSDMIHRVPAARADTTDAWRCSGCVERRYFAGGETRAEVWAAMGQEGFPTTDYWRRRARRKGEAQDAGN